MWKCHQCKNEFLFPEIKRSDAGLVNGEGILGLRKMDPVSFCPECMSTDIEKIIQRTIGKGVNV